VDSQFALQARLQKEIDDELGARVAAHKANVARLEAGRLAAANLTVGLGNRPLVLLAQGDSWFDYPLDGNFPAPGGTDLIAHLRRLGSMPPTILNLAVAGSTAVSEMSLKRQASMIAQLRDTSNWPDGKPDAILFSAGGNDIAGDEFCIFLNFNDGASPGLNADRFAGALAGVRACYLDLFAVRDRIVPGVPVFGHCYDFPIPNGAHPICAGPWLKPSLDFCNWSVAVGTGIVHDALAAFRTMLQALEADPKNNFHLIDTQGTLSPADWANELHPKPDGFNAIARKFAAALDSKLRPTFGPNFLASIELPPGPTLTQSIIDPAEAPAKGRTAAKPRKPRGTTAPKAARTVHAS
jgi:hypothetical protein